MLYINIVCSSKGTLLSTPAYTVCLCAGDIRLVGGSDPLEGTVELFYEGKWAKVALDNSPERIFDHAVVADVACRQAGYPYSEGLQSFGQGSGPVWLIIFWCYGDEERVEQCLHSSGWRTICSSCLDLGVRCRGGRCGTRITHKHTVARCLSMAASYFKLHTISPSLP